MDQAPVITLSYSLLLENDMPKTFEVTFNDDETQPDLIAKAAAIHGIPPELLLKRLISRGLDEYREPMKDVSEFETLDAFFKGNGLLK